MDLKDRIITILKQHKHNCKFKESVERALYPFILIDPNCKADELIDFIKNEVQKSGG